MFWGFLCLCLMVLLAGWAKRRESSQQKSPSTPPFPDTAPLPAAAPALGAAAAAPAQRPWDQAGDAPTADQPGAAEKLASATFTLDELAAVARDAQEHRDRRAIEARRRADEARSNALAAAQAAAQAKAAAWPPAPIYGRWSIRYLRIEASGEQVVTHRVIRILRVRPNIGLLDCWCELRQQERTFALFRIVDAADADTGELIDIPAWLTDYRRGRRGLRT